MQRCCPATAPEHNEEQCRQLVPAVGHYGNARAGRKEGRQTGELYKEIKSGQLQGHYRIKEFLFNGSMLKL